jgi:hypothetical protein
LTIADPAASGFATMYPCANGLPPTSNLNYTAGTNVANMVTVRPDSAGRVCVYTNRAAEVVVDVLGVTGAGFDGIVPQRLLDTRTR